MKLLLNIYLFICLSLQSNLANALSIEQLNNSNLLSIISYNIVSEEIVENTLVRTLKINVSSNVNDQLEHVYLHLDGKPQNVTNDGSLYFPVILPGQTQESNNSIKIIVDLKHQQMSTIELIWLIEAELNGKKIIDEIAVKEQLNL